MDGETYYGVSYTEDIVCSFIRDSVKELKLLKDDVIDNLLPVTTNFAGSPVLIVMKVVVKLFDEKLVKDVGAERVSEVENMEDLQAHHIIVNKSFCDVMNGWFKRDGHQASWERIIMLIHFTRIMVHQNIFKYNQKCGERIKELVEMAVEYIRKNMHSCIEQNGGWNGMMSTVNMTNGAALDIPTTTRPRVVLSPFTAPLPDYLGQPTPKTNLSSFTPDHISYAFSSPTHVSVNGQTAPSAFGIELHERETPRSERVETSIVAPSFHTLVDESFTDSEEDSEEDEPAHRSYDVMMAYLTHNLTERNKVEHTLDSVVKSFYLFFAPYEEDFLGSDILAAAIKYAQKILVEIGDDYCKVLCDWRSEITTMLDVNEKRFLVQVALEKMLFSWFIQDNRFLVWDRVVIILEFTSDLVYALLVKHGCHAWLHISELLKYMETFFSKRVDDSIYLLGGWKTVLEAKKDMFRTGKYDIPSSVIFDPGVYVYPGKLKPDKKSKEVRKKEKKELKELLDKYVVKERFGYPVPTWSPNGINHLPQQLST